MSGRGIGRDRALTVAAGITTVIAAVIGAVRLGGYDGSPRLPAERAPRAIHEWQELGLHGARTGPPAPVLTIVVFSDYLCPHCSRTDEDLRHLRIAYPTEVAIVYRHFPIRGDLSFPAALAAECGRIAGRFESINARLYAQVDSLGVKPWAQIAHEAGVADTIRFNRCLEGTQAREAIDRDLSAARAVGVRGTPAILMNDLLFRGSPGRSYMEAYLRSERRRRR